MQTLINNSEKLNTIEEAIEDIRNGKIIIVVDDEDRENEGDFLAAAEKVSPEMKILMQPIAKVLIAAPLQNLDAKNWVYMQWLLTTQILWKPPLPYL